MKKMMIGFLCLTAIMSCEIPQSITIKGNPGVYLPLGSPFSDGNRLEDYINPEEIKKSISNSDADSTHKVKVYDYQGGGDYADVQAYIVHYPIVEMKLDLEEYINDMIKNNEQEKDTYVIPGDIAASLQNQFPKYLTGTKGPQDNEDKDDPLFRIPLADMVKLVEEVTGNGFGLQMTYNDFFYDNVEIKIPAFGIDNYTKGTKVGDKLRFVNTAKNKFIPKSKSNNGDLNDKNEIEIFVKLTGPGSGTIDPEMVFDWTSAIVRADSNPIKGKHAITNQLGEFLGKGSEFKKITGYIYVTDFDTATMSITAAGSPLVEPGTSIHPQPRPSFPDSDTGSFPGKLPSDSLINGIDLTDIFNSSFKSSLNLEYEIQINLMTITPDNKGETITADLVILIPLELKISNQSGENDYVKLELKEDIFPKPGNGDLFMRTGKNNSDDLLNNLETVKIILEKLQNNITNNFSLLIASGAYCELLSLTVSDQKLFLEIKPNELPYPFNPRFEILLKKDQNQPYATLKINRQDPDNPAKFDFFLTVEAQVKINHTMDL
jgi:hypothetical protein